VFAIYPFTQTQRFEAEVSTSIYSYRIDQVIDYYDKNMYYLGSKYQRNIDAPPGFKIAQLNLAYNFDNSYMGIASPLMGQRIRIGVDKYFGKVTFPALLLDYRKYLFKKPVCLAFRAFHYGRYGSDVDNSVFYSMWLSYPWFVRGYENYPYETNDSKEKQNRLRQLYGNRIIVSNLELRIPFTGPKRLCLIPSKYLFTELAFFIDGGLAWDKGDKINLDITADKEVYKVPMLTYGASIRFNVFGMLVLEPYYAFPIQKDGTKYASFGLNFLPGW
jgi:outer membrane protein assembly factor BamA